MLIRFWGTRGSIPVALTGAGVRSKITQALLQANGRRFDDEAAVERFIDGELDFPVRHSYGGNSACVDIVGGTEYLVCDMGSGLRSLGQQVMREHGPEKPQVYNFFMSHVHWDHIMGFPFFPPAYIPGNTIRIHGCHPLAVLQEALHRQQSDPCFPVDWKSLGADIQLVHLEPEQWHEINGFRVKAKLQPHHGDSYGYGFEKDRKVVVYSTDGEHTLESAEATEAMIDFFRNADLVIFDAMYSLADMITVKADWGHSSNVVGVDLCLRANVKHYCMFHHEPGYDDAALYDVLQETIRYEEIMREGAPLQVSTAYDMAMLPAPRAIAGLPEHLAFHALLEPAKEVGGDLYDAFMLDEDHFFFIVGDVAGKGVPASLFMALSKTLCKSLALRQRMPLDALITALNHEVARDNPRALFVTAIAGILDVHTGEMELCSAGHEAPMLLRRSAAPCALPVTGGPPLCILEDFAYPADRIRLQAGDLLLMMTDGVTEAQDTAQMLYGLERVIAYCHTIQNEREPRGVLAVCQGLYDDVKRFVRDAEPCDDITIMAIRFTAPPAMSPLPPGEG